MLTTASSGIIREVDDPIVDIIVVVKLGEVNISALSNLMFLANVDGVISGSGCLSRAGGASVGSGAAFVVAK